MKEIKYILRGVSVEQFATPSLPSLDDYDVNVSIPIKSNYQEHAIAIGANVQFLSEGKVFIIRPDAPLGIRRTERDKEKMQMVYNRGIAQGEKELAALKEFLK